MTLDISTRLAIVAELEQMVNKALSERRNVDAYAASVALTQELRDLAQRIEENFTICLRRGLEQSALAAATAKTIKKGKRGQ